MSYQNKQQTQKLHLYSKEYGLQHSMRTDNYRAETHNATNMRFVEKIKINQYLFWKNKSKYLQRIYIK